MATLVRLVPPMLYVDTYLAPSPIHGIGLFAARHIPRGALIWAFAPGFDQAFTREDIDRLTEPCRRRVLQYAYYNAARRCYILCADDARFINSSEHPNTVSVGFGSAAKEGQTFAARDIPAHEEITEDYRAFESNGHVG